MRLPALTLFNNFILFFFFHTALMCSSTSGPHSFGGMTKCSCEQKRLVKTHTVNTASNSVNKRGITHTRRRQWKYSFITDWSQTGPQNQDAQRTNMHKCAAKRRRYKHSETVWAEVLCKPSRAGRSFKWCGRCYLCGWLRNLQILLGSDTADPRPVSGRTFIALLY